VVPFIPTPLSHSKGGKLQEQGWTKKITSFDSDAAGKRKRKKRRKWEVSGNEKNGMKKEKRKKKKK